MLKEIIPQKIKLFKPLVEAVVKSLQEIFNENRKADKAIGGILKSNAKWGARDRAFIAENTYEIVRNWRLIKYCAEFGGKIVYSDQDFYFIVATWLTLNNYDLADYRYFPEIDRNQLFKRFDEGQKIRKLKYSLPDWLDELGLEEFGEEWEKEIAAMHAQAEVFLRVNTLKTTKKQIINLLNEKQKEVKELPNVKDALVLKKRSNVFGLEEYKNGLFEVQDAGSQLISEFLNPLPGQRVIDACAGAGGKSLHLATLMGNKGKVISMDIEDFKLIELKKRAKRNGIDTIETRIIEPKTLKRLKESADCLLLDVPCSGLGVLKRNPDAKWKLKPTFIEEVINTQAEILEEYTKMLKKGGRAVYATCSILKSENENQINKFLNNHPEFRLIKQQRISPFKEGFDGFYMALLEKY
jgi:16S rRNA (cytosine967-C5)-methyltransferase